MTDEQFKQLMDKLEEIKTVSILKVTQDAIVAKPASWESKVPLLGEINDHLRKVTNEHNQNS